MTRATVRHKHTTRRVRMLSDDQPRSWLVCISSVLARVCLNVRLEAVRVVASVVVVVMSVFLSVIVVEVISCVLFSVVVLVFVGV